MPGLQAIRRVLGHLNPLLIDGIVALILFAPMAALFTGQQHLLPGQHPATPLTWALAVLLIAPILTHRRFPLASLAVCLAALLAYAAGRSAAYPGLGLPVFVLTFYITLNNSRRVALVALFTSAAAIAFSLALQPAHVAPPANWIASELGVLVAWLAGRNLRHSRARWAELQARAELLEREREEQDRRAVTEERLRIARDLHDVIAHSMSVIAVQSAVGLHVMDTQPAQVRQAMAAIEAISRSALTEMRLLLGVLRQEGQTRGSLTPAPGLADLDSLISQVQDAGVRVRISADGQRGTIPPGIDLSAYRIIQEALTNVIKHAGSPSAEVSIKYCVDSLTVEVTDQGRRILGTLPAYNPPARTGSGHGIIGMRERVAVFGGEFTAGPGSDGGFGVRARFPIPEVAG